MEAPLKEIDKDWGRGGGGWGVVRPPFFQARFLRRFLEARVMPEKVKAVLAEF